MLEKIVTDKNLQGFIEPELLQLIAERSLSSISLQIINRVYYLAELERQKGIVRILDFQIHSQLKALAEKLEITVEHLVKKQQESILNLIQRRLEEKLERNIRIYKVGQIVDALTLFPTDLQLLEESQAKNEEVDLSWLEDFLTRRESTLHPQLVVELQRYIYSSRGIQGDIEIQPAQKRTLRFKWESKWGIDVPKDANEREEIFQSYFRVIDQFVAIDAQTDRALQLWMNEHHPDLNIEDPAYYVIVFDSLNLISYETLYHFFDHFRSEPYIQIQALQLLSSQLGEVRFTYEIYQNLAQYLSQLSYEQFMEYLDPQFTIVDYLKTFVDSQTQEEPESIVVSQQINIEELVRDGHLPDFNEESYRQLLPELITWARQYIKDKATQEKITLPEDPSDTVRNDHVLRILENWKEYRELFIRLFRKKGKTVHWTLVEVEVIAVVIEYEKRNWGADSKFAQRKTKKSDFTTENLVMSDGQKIRFINNLRETNNAS